MAARSSSARGAKSTATGRHHAFPELRQCTVCLHVVRLRASGMVRHSKLPLWAWVHALMLLTADKRGVSALALRRHLGLGSYRTAWLMLHKVRLALWLRDERYQLQGTVELDGASIGSRAAENQDGILVAIESRTYVDKKGRSKVVAGFAKCEVAPETTVAAEDFLKRAVKPTTQVNTDASSALVAIAGFDTDHRKMGHDKEALDAWLPHPLHFVENAKSWLVGTCRGIRKKYLPFYAAGYTYRFNRRNSKDTMFHHSPRAISNGVPCHGKCFVA